MKINLILKEYDVVELKQSSDDIPLPAGTKGTVLMVHDGEPQAYEVEFMDGDDSLGVFTVKHSELKPI